MQISQVMAAVGAATGAAAMGVGSVTDRIDLTVVGSALLLVSAMAVCVQVILRALRDTAAERAALIEERELAIAAQVAVANERARLRADAIRSRKATQDLLARERLANDRAVEAKRFAIQRHGFEVGVQMALSGSLDEMPDPAAGVLVQLPVRQPLDDVMLAASDD